MKDIIQSAQTGIADIEDRIERAHGVITGTPWVVELAAGLYLVADGEGYRGGSITGAVVCYTPERIDGAVEHIRSTHGDVFGNARKVDRRDALQTELTSMRDILARAERIAALQAA